MCVRIATAALILLSAISPASAGVEQYLGFCLGLPPENNPALRAFYDAQCPAILKDGLEAAKRETRRNEAAATADLVGKLSDNLKPAEGPLPDMAAFSSNAQRRLSDLAFAAGKKGAAAILGAGAKTSPRPRILLVKDAGDASLWFDGVDAAAVLGELAAVRDRSAEISGRTCAITSAPVQKFSLLAAAAATGTAAITAAYAVAKFFQTLQPQLLSAAAVAPPNDLRSVFLAGLQAGGDADFVVKPPLIHGSNAVLGASAEAAAALQKAAAHVGRMAAEKNKFDPECVEAAAEVLSDLTAKLKSLGTKDEKPDLGSPLERAARVQAMDDAGIEYLLQVDLTAAGGSVSVIKPSWYRTLRLFSGGDLAVVAWKYSRSGEVKSIDYRSVSCGRAIPLSDFSEDYGSKCE